MQSSINAAHARNLHLLALGLAHPPATPATKPDVLAAIERMGMLQIDTIHVVARSPYLVLFSRLGHYDPTWLDQLLSEGALFEYWAHEACFLPRSLFPYYRRLILSESARRSWTYQRDWLLEQQALVDTIVARIREKGPVLSSDFERTDGERGGWWNWKAEKRALEYLFTAGELMVARRVRFQRVYDLRERVIPDWDDANAPALAHVHRELALRAVRALGIARPRDVADYFRRTQRETLHALHALREEGALHTVTVDGWTEPALVHPDNLPLLDQAHIEPTYTTLLSPFDPLIWDRRRALDLFGFEYRIECYTPAPKRRYGYFTLPILWRGTLVGRLDAKAHRADQRFEVKALHLEPHAPVNEALAQDLATALHATATWHNTPEITVNHSDPPAFLDLLRRALAR